MASVTNTNNILNTGYFKKIETDLGVLVSDALSNASKIVTNKSVNDRSYICNKTTDTTLRVSIYQKGPSRGKCGNASVLTLRKGAGSNNQYNIESQLVISHSGGKSPFDSSGNYTGEGKVELPDGSLYKGNFKDGKFHGYVQNKSKNYNNYKTLFVNGMFSCLLDKSAGTKKIVLPDGSVYDGEFQDGKFHGLGRFTSPDGSLYEGQFQDGKFHGEGTFTPPKEKGTSYEATWENGKFVSLHIGSSVRTEEETNGENCDGFTQCPEVYLENAKLLKSNGETVGNAYKLQLPDGSLYEGQFQDGKFHGLGRFTSPDGSLYEGQFQDGKFHGEGQLRYPDGSQYSGNFLDGKKSGRFNFKKGVTNCDLDFIHGEYGGCVFEAPFDIPVINDFPKEMMGESNDAHIVFGNGWRYEGSTENGLMHGAGKLSFCDPETDSKYSYEGSFKDG